MATVKVKFRPSTVYGRNGTVYYQVIHRRVVRQIKTDCRINESEWDLINQKSNDLSSCSHDAEHLFAVRMQISCDTQRLRDIISRMENTGKQYTADSIVSKFLEGEKQLSLFGFMKDSIDHMMKAGKYRTAETYSDTLKSFYAFRKGVDLRLDEINSEMMQLYEAHMRTKGLVRNTTSFYMRILRAAYNRAVENGMVEQRFPFKHVYTGIDKTQKRAIPVRVIKKMKALNLSMYPSLEFARDMFLFSFYTRGMAFVDMAFLKKKNLQNGILSYCRSKTRQLLYVKWERCMAEIVTKHATGNSEYLLPIITVAGSPADNHKKYRSVQRVINSNLKVIAKMVGLKGNLSMYVSRHSWASAARSNHVPVSIISEGMGHDSEATTLIYLNSLDTSAVDKANLTILKNI